MHVLLVLMMQFHSPLLHKRLLFLSQLSGIEAQTLAMSIISVMKAIMMGSNEAKVNNNTSLFLPVCSLHMISLDSCSLFTSLDFEHLKSSNCLMKCTMMFINFVCSCLLKVESILSYWFKCKLKLIMFPDF